MTIEYAHHECDQHIGAPRPKLWCGSRLVHEGHHWDWLNPELRPYALPVSNSGMTIRDTKMWCDGATEEEVN